MMDVSRYLAFLGAIAVLVVVPGPDMMLILALGIRGGPGTGLMAALGVAAGLSVHACAAVLGLSAMFAALPAQYHVLLRCAGAGYLLYVAVRAFRERSVAALGHGPITPTTPTTPTTGPSRARAFGQAMATNLLNPKVILFNITFLPSFIQPDRGHVSLQLAILGISLVVVDLAVDGSVGLLAGRLASALRRSSRLGAALRVASGALLAGLAIHLAFTHN
jgi:threonine/homoserine/homoserine lactone efflux protein